MFSIGFNNSNLTFNPTTSSKVTYPFISWDNVFNNEEIKDVLSYFDKQPVEESILKNPTSNQIVRRFKTRNHSFNSVNADNRWILEGLRNAADAINKEFFRFDLSGIETFQYTVYDGTNSSKYDYHLDMVLGDGPTDTHLTKKLAFSYILSDDTEYQGGDLEFLVAEGISAKAEQKKGRLIAYPSFIMHRVTPVLSGRRKSIVFWALGPKFK